MVRIRLRRMGAKKKPFYRIVVSDKRSPRDGRFIETIGTYDPLTKPETVTLQHARAAHWLGVGAQPSEAVARLLKGASLLAMGLWVFGSTAYQVLVFGLPKAEIMGAIGVLALAANVASVLLLMRYKDGDANVRSVWLCSRNDAIGNVAVLVASVAVWQTASPWPDLVVAIVMAGLFLRSSQLILFQAWQEYRSGEDTRALESHGHDHAH